MTTATATTAERCTRLAFPSAVATLALVTLLVWLPPLADFAGVSGTTTVTAWILGHGLTLTVAPTSVVLVGGLAIAKVGYDAYLRFVWPLLLALLVVSVLIVGVVASTG